MLGHIATLKIVTMCAQNADVYSFDYLIAVLWCVLWCELWMRKHNEERRIHSQFDLLAWNSREKNEIVQFKPHNVIHLIYSFDVVWRYKLIKSVDVICIRVVTHNKNLLNVARLFSKLDTLNRWSLYVIRLPDSAVALGQPPSEATRRRRWVCHRQPEMSHILTIEDWGLRA